jgi:phytoene synthase
MTQGDAHGTPADVSIDRVLVGAGERAACRVAIQDGSRTFHAASLLLPVHVRIPACALYAFCRLADDAIDRSDDPRAALNGLVARLDRAYGSGRPAIAADRAVAATFRHYAIPRALPEALLEGFAWDAGRRRFETLADLRAYGARVAGTVGVMMSLVMGTRDPIALARAADLGVAMQLSNIARDVGEDARAGRVYLPLEWLYEAHIDPDAFLRSPRYTPGLGRIVARLVAEADTLYRRATAGITALPWRCRPAIHAASALYAAIGHVVVSRRGDSVSSRAVVGPARKTGLLARALLAASWPAGRSVAAPALAETAFLIEAVVREDAARRVAEQPPAPWHAPREQLRRVYALFERLERRDREVREPMLGTSASARAGAP